MFFGGRNESAGNPSLKDLAVSPEILLPSVPYRQMQSVFKCSWTLVLTTYSHVASKLKKK
jgi:hypothetical protein